ICRIDEDRGRISMTHEWCAPGAAALHAELQDLPVTDFQWRINQLLEFGEIWIPDPEQLPPEAAAERAFLETHGIRSLATTALYTDDQLSGFVCFHLGEGAAFHPTDMPVIHALATSFSNAFWRFRMENLLQTRQEQMLQSQKLESIGRLAGGVAHDFNNMLSVILGFADLILERMPEDDPNRADLAEIHKAASRSRSLAGQLLAFARKQSSEPRILNINKIIADSANLLHKLVGERVQLKITPDASLGDISMDATQLNQVLMNLIVNARDALPAGGIIELATRSVVVGEGDPEFPADLAPGEYAELSLSDNGTGMSPEVLEHLFEPFFTTKKTGQGTGLGLSTVYGIVHQHQGEILVRSAPGAGSTFALYFPRSRGSRSASTQGVPALSSSQGHELILLVEDEPALLRLGTSVLSRSGYRVLAADSPTKALSLIQSASVQPDLLITDVVMPEMNGRDLFEELRKSRPGLPCLFMSGYTSEIIDRQGILAADVHFLQKPFRASILLQKVRAVLDGAPSPDRPG
ncbi:response regulator, partial [Myxococcota bacterium]|nr:response regulator [Myxococcota bacterium]